ncbi:MAG: hypothetical protein AB7K24_26965 [Gemmataceae bacterium]
MSASMRVLSLVGLLLSCVAARADEADISKALKDKGVAVTETKGVVTGVSVKAGDTLTDADFAHIGKLSQLKTLDINKGLNDERLALLGGLSELQYLQTNLAQVTDDGLKPLARLKNLRNLKFFHPGKEFSGAGLAHLAELPNLQQLTVAGSYAFNDEGLAAVARLPQLHEFRTWHAGSTDEGVKKLAAMKNLKSLYLGQRLTYKPPACPSDATVAIVADMKMLEALELHEARLSLKALGQLKQLANLKKLTLGGVEITKADVEQLQKELPGVKISWTEPNEIYQKRINALFGK